MKIQLKTSLLLILIIATASLVVMTGWIVESKLLVQVIPNRPPMQFNTALLFLASAVCLFYLLRQQFYIVITVAALILIVSSITLSEYTFDVDLGIDQFFVTPFLSDKTVHPGRMSPNTTFCFIMFSIGMLLEALLWEENYFPAKLLIFSGILIVLSTAGIAGHITGIHSIYGWAYSGMAIHTCIGFFLTGVALILYGWANPEFVSNRYFSISFLIFFGSLTVLYISVETSNNHRVADHKKHYLPYTSRVAANFQKNANDFIDKLKQSPESLDLSTPSRTVDYFQLDDQNQYVSFQTNYPKKIIELLGKISNSQAQTYWGERKDTFIAIQIDGHICFLSRKNSEPQVINTIAFLKPANAIQQWLDDDTHVLFTVSLFDEKNHLASDWRGVSIPQPVTIGYWQGYLLFNGLGKSLDLYDKLWVFNLLLGLLFSIALALLSHLFLNSRQKQHNLHTIIESATTGLVACRTDGKVVFFNPEAERIFGYSKDEIVGTSIERLVPINRKKHEQHRDLFFEKGVSRRMGTGVLYGKKKNDNKIALEINLTFIKDKGENLVLATIFDIDQRYFQRRNIEKKKVYLQTIFDHLNEGIITVNKSGLIEFVNAAACNILGYPQQELKGQSFFDFLQFNDVHGTPLDKTSCNLLQAVKFGKQTKNTSNILWGNSGKAIHIMEFCYPMVENGTITSAVMIFNPMPTTD